MYCSSSIRWLTSSLVHSDPRGISPDISMTPAPVTPAIPGHTPHSRAEDHAFPPADSSGQNPVKPAARHCQRHDPRQAPGRPHRSPMTTAHPQPPSPEGTNHPAGTRLNGLPDPDPHHRRYSTGNPRGADPPPGYRPDRARRAECASVRAAAATPDTLRQHAAMARELLRARSPAAARILDRRALGQASLRRMTG